MPYVAASFDVPSDKESLDAALEGLVRVNLVQLRRRPRSPLYRSQVRYRRDKGETWDAADKVYARRWGDCEDLAAIRAAEYRIAGVAARAVVRRSRSPGVAWHCVVQLPGGRYEDPSLRLGMV